jgi:hypothetical protein
LCHGRWPAVGTTPFIRRSAIRCHLAL